MKAIKKDNDRQFVTRAEFEGLYSVVKSFGDSIISRLCLDLMEDRYLRTADPTSELSQHLRKKRGKLGLKKGHLFQLVPKLRIG
jgi:hypothetical protein